MFVKILNRLLGRARVDASDVQATHQDTSIGR